MTNMTKDDIKDIVDRAVTLLSSEISQAAVVVEEQTDIDTDADLQMVEECLELVEEQEEKVKMAKIANEAIKNVRLKMAVDFSEYDMNVRNAIVSLIPDIFQAMVKKDKIFLMKIVHVSGTALKFYIQDFIKETAADLLTTGLTDLSKDISKKFEKMKEDMVKETAEPTDFEEV